MIINRKRAASSLRLRAVSCLLFTISAGLAVLAGIASSRATDQGGSASPFGAVASSKAAEDDDKRIVGSADISPRRFRESISQRVEDNAFHLKIAPWVIERTNNGQKAEFFVVLADQADLSGAVNLATKAEKGRYVYEELRNKSQATQGPVLRWLRERGIEHRSFYIVNAILVKGSREVAEALAAVRTWHEWKAIHGSKSFPQAEAVLKDRRHRSDRRQFSRA